VKQNVLSITLLCITLFAACLGLFAQDIAYYFADGLFDESPFKVLIIVTLTSIDLFIIVFVVEVILLASQQIKPKIFIRMLIANVLIGSFVSI